MGKQQVVIFNVDGSGSSFRSPTRLLVLKAAAVCTDDARWITGQVIDSEGGFRRWAS